MEALPVEIWELIFSFCDDKSLAVAVPRLCKFSRELAGPNSGVWRMKCLAKGITDRSEKITFKRRYFATSFKMFPLLGHFIGLATYDELKNHPGATCGSSGQSRYVTIEKHNFWVDDKGLFTHMYIARGIYPLPKEWEDFGITWNRSWLDYKDLFKRWNGNFEVVTAPHYREFQNKPCFSARLTTVARDSDKVCYQVDLNFNYSEGQENSTNTLYSISIAAHNYIGSKNIQNVYEQQKIIDKPAELDLNNVGK
eukprot:TRINITY_DN7250_c0_g1_i1.p1 TRINITY_DN7250_c0_g1~~TRINITY_DN7250_c0_g1_i1.p1  ORF type:complete len:278 (-),score=34.05 TRINITY_DN7250_c0_g1_i1:13-771(-)